MSFSIKLSFFFVLLFFLSSCTTTYLGRYISWNKIDVYDYQNYPARNIETGSTLFSFESDSQNSAQFKERIKRVTYRAEKSREKTEAELEEFLEFTNTTAFLIIQNNTIVYENYFKGYNESSTFPSFSIAKSITSALIGIALDEGLIHSINDPVSLYIDEFSDPDLSDITIKNLLSMASGFRHKFSNAPFSDATRSYFSPDLRANALKVKPVEDPEKYFIYDNCNTQLMGMILERVSQMSVSSYTEEKLWKQIGTESDAFWNLDSEKSGFEMMAMGFNARARDYARFGQLYLNKGNWDGVQVISQDWINESTLTNANSNNTDEFYKYNREEDGPIWDFFVNQSGYYSYCWWGYQIDRSNSDYFAFGILDQYIYLCPEKNLMIIRFGENSGGVFWWPEVLKDIAGRM